MLGARDRAEHGAQDQASQQHHQEKTAGRWGQGEEGAPQFGGIDGGPALGQGRQDGDGDQYGGDGHVLSQQDGEGGASGLAVDPSLGREHRHDHGGRGQGQAHAQNRSAGQRLAQSHEGDGDDDRADGDLQHPQTEDEAPHGL
ncbi:hypothetical protein D3C72_1031910 [compost metagenome]